MRSRSRSRRGLRPRPRSRRAKEDHGRDQVRPSPSQSSLPLHRIRNHPGAMQPFQPSTPPYACVHCLFCMTRRLPCVGVGPADLVSEPACTCHAMNVLCDMTPRDVTWRVQGWQVYSMHAARDIVDAVAGVARWCPDRALRNDAARCAGLASRRLCTAAGARSTRSA